jgi:hypothetical protein
MSVNKSNDSSRVVKGQELEIDHLTQVASITPRQARRLLQKLGADWPKLKREAEALKPKTDDI